MKNLIFWLAALVAVLGAMVSGAPGGMIWLVALLAALIMVRRSWSKRDDRPKDTTEPGV